ASVRDIQPAEVDTWRGVHYDGLVLDVRDANEWDDALGHVAGAASMPSQDLPARLGELEPYKNKSVLVYDRDGLRARSAGQVLVNAGFRDVSVIAGGLVAYRKLVPR